MLSVSEDFSIELSGTITDLTEKEEAPAEESSTQCPYLHKLTKAHEYE